MSEIKLIVTDLDGTLLNDDHQIPSNFWNIQKKLQEKGVIFAIASGRQYYNILKKFEPIKNEIFILAENGTYVKYGEKEVFLNTMPIEEAHKFIKLARTFSDTQIILCGKKSGYIEYNNQEYYDKIKIFFEHLEIVDDLLLVDDIALKVTLTDFINAEQNSYKILKESYGGDFKIAMASDFYVDITPLNSNKGTAIKEIQKKLNISTDETLVFGDMLNDLEMMQVAKYSYAMKNAHQKVKEIANFETTFDNNENGVLDIIKKMFSLN